jgi:hypothetical protein
MSDQKTEVAVEVLNACRFERASRLVTGLGGDL